MKGINTHVAYGTSEWTNLRTNIWITQYYITTCLWLHNCFFSLITVIDLSEKHNFYSLILFGKHWASAKVEDCRRRVRDNFFYRVCLWTKQHEKLYINEKSVTYGNLIICACILIIKVDSIPALCHKYNLSKYSTTENRIAYGTNFRFESTKIPKYGLWGNNVRCPNKYIWKAL